MPALPGPALLCALAGLTYALTGSLAAAFLAAAAAWLAWEKPEWLVLLLVVLAPMVRSPSNRVLSGDVIAPAKAVGVYLLGAAWFLRRTGAPLERPLPAWLSAFLAAWAGFTLLTLLNSTDVARSVRYVLMSGSGVVLFLVTYALPSRWRHRLVLAALAVGVPIGILVVVQYLVVEHRLFTFLETIIIEPRTLAFQQFSADPGPSRSYRPFGTMTHPNSMGLYFALLIPFSFALLTVRALPRWARVAVAGAGLVMFAGLLATNSRAALLTFAVAIVYLCRHRAYRRVATAAAIVVLLTGAYYALPKNREGARQTLIEFSRVRYGLSGRNDIWRKSARLIREAPLLGVGPGNFPTEFVSHFGYFRPNDELEQMGQIWMIQTLGDKIVGNFNAHNLYLQLWGELGILGPLLFLAGVGFVVWASERKARAAPPASFRRAAALASASCAVALVAYGIFDAQIAITQFSLNLIMGPLLAVGLRA